MSDVTPTTHETRLRAVGGRARDAEASPAQAPHAPHLRIAPTDGSTRKAEGRLRVIVGDPDPLARRAIRDALDAASGFLITAEAKDGVELVELALHYRPELVLAEVALPALDGIAACTQIAQRAPEVRVVMFSVPQSRETELRALRAGASGFLSKSMSIESIGRALRSVAGGEAAVSRSLATHLIAQLRASAENGRGMRPVKSPLTTREWEVLDLICAGQSTREISTALFLSEDTVYSHTKSILRKLGVHSRADAAAAAGRLRQPGHA